MHVALVIDHLGMGGAQRSVLKLAAGLGDRGHQVDVVFFRSSSHRTCHPIPSNVRLFAIGRDSTDGAQRATRDLLELRTTRKAFDIFRLAGAFGWRFSCLPRTKSISQARAFASYMARENPDCILPSLGLAHLVCFLATGALKHHPPIIPIFRDFVKPVNAAELRVERKLLNAGSHFVGISQGVSDSMSATLGIPSERVTTIYNPVVTVDFQVEMMGAPCHPWLVQADTPVILAAGRLVEQKDYPTLIKAFALLTARRPCRLIIIGEGKERKALEELVAQLGVNDRASLPGWVPNPRPFMTHAALFVLSSLHEGFGNVLVEAMACGCPCVSTDCPAGPSEILQGGQVGPLVPVGDVEALAQAMDDVLEEPPDKQLLKQRAEYFSVERAAEAYEELISGFV